MPPGGCRAPGLPSGMRSSLVQMACLARGCIRCRNSCRVGSSSSRGSLSFRFFFFLSSAWSPAPASAAPTPSPSGTVLPPVGVGLSSRLLAEVPVVYLLQARGTSVLPYLKANCEAWGGGTCRQRLRASVGALRWSTALRPFDRASSPLCPMSPSTRAHLHHQPHGVHEGFVEVALRLLRLLHSAEPHEAKAARLAIPASSSGGWRSTRHAWRMVSPGGPDRRTPLTPQHLVRMTLASVTSPLSEKCSRSRCSSTYFGSSFTQILELLGRGGADSAAGASPASTAPSWSAIPC